MGGTVLVNFLYQCIKVVDLADCRDCKAAQMRLNQQRLRLEVGNTSDTEIALHLVDIPLKLGAERGIFDVVDCTVKAALAVSCHAAASCAEMRMVINAIKKF